MPRRKPPPPDFTPLIAPTRPARPAPEAVQSSTVVTRDELLAELKVSPSTFDHYETVSKVLYSNGKTMAKGYLREPSLAMVRAHQKYVPDPGSIGERQELVKLELQELDLATKKRDMLNVRVVRIAVAKRYKKIKQLFMELGGNISTELAGLDTEGRKVAIDRAVMAVFKEVAADYQLAPGDSDDSR